MTSAACSPRNDGGFFRGEDGRNVRFLAHARTVRVPRIPSVLVKRRGGIRGEAVEPVTAVDA
jgi:hypothetical protein